MTQKESEIAESLTFHAFDPDSLAFVPVAIPMKPGLKGPVELLASANASPDPEPVAVAPKVAASVEYPRDCCIWQLPP